MAQAWYGQKTQRQRRLERYIRDGWHKAPCQPSGGESGVVQGMGDLGLSKEKRPVPQLPVYIGRKTKRNVPRSCLQCGEKFTAETKYYRLCRRCRYRSGLFEYNH